MDEPQQLACVDKIAFGSQKEAVTAATVAQYQHGGTRLKAYKCKHCGLWHLASLYQDK